METILVKRKKRVKKTTNQFFAFRTGENIVLFGIWANGNSKVAPIGERTMKTYTFSSEQWNYTAKSLGDFNFFAMDRSNCLGCKYSHTGREGNTRCYTHKFHELSGFIRTIKSAKANLPDVLPTFEDFNSSELIKAAKGLYIRFGVYGEPIFIPKNLLQELTETCKSWTGYTHQWQFYPDYMPYLMASTDTIQEYTTAKKIGWRCFHVISDYSFIPSKSVLCPEIDSEILTCSTCNLCSGLNVAAKDILMPKH